MVWLCQPVPSAASSDGYPLDRAGYPSIATSALVISRSKPVDNNWLVALPWLTTVVQVSDREQLFSAG